ncbi:Hypothetical predicted protein, partial [Olea europaea subsp. europaea]
QRLVTTRLVLRTTRAAPQTRFRSQHAHVAKYALGALEAHMTLRTYASSRGVGEPYSFQKWTHGSMAWQPKAR